MKKGFLLIFYCLFLLLPLIPDQILELDKIEDQWIEVAVDGAVSEPKKIRCPAYSRLSDILEDIELLPEADLSVYSVNMILKDNDVLMIPEKGEQKKISVNTASLQQLCEIPGVGEATALKILQYREEQGLFQSLEDLMKIPGIKNKKWEKMKEYICL